MDVTKSIAIESKFRFVAIAQICVFAKKTNRTDKFRNEQIKQMKRRIEQIEQKC